MVDALHGRLRGFPWRSRGVATRRLQRYLWWFCWEEQAGRSDATREGMLCARRERELRDAPPGAGGRGPALLGLLGGEGRIAPSISTVV